MAWDIPEGDAPGDISLVLSLPDSLPLLPLGSIFTLISLICTMKPGPVTLPDMKLRLQLIKEVNSQSLDLRIGVAVSLDFSKNHLPFQWEMGC